MSGIGPLNRVQAKRGEIGHAAITASTAGTANLLLTADSESRLIRAQNLTDVEIMMTLDGVDFWRFPTNTSMSFDFGNNGSTPIGGASTTPIVVPATVIGVYHTGTGPSSGAFQIVSIPTRRGS